MTIKIMKDRTRKFRLSSEEETALKRTAKLAKVPISVLIRLCLTSQHHIATDPAALRRTISSRTAT